MTMNSDEARRTIESLNAVGSPVERHVRPHAKTLADHIEQRLLTWRQRTMNKSGDQLALDDFMDKESLADLIDFVCDEYAMPVQKPLTEQQSVSCIVEAGCLGTVKMSYDTGPYEITRTSFNADKLVKAIERAHGIFFGA